MKKELISSTTIERDLLAEKKVKSRVIKLLLLGTGESGKSTIFKQMQILYEHGFTDHDKNTYRHVIRRNVLESMQTLIDGVERFGLTYGSPQAYESAKWLEGIDPLAAEFWDPKICQHVKVLWKDKAILAAFAQRSKLQLPDSSQYFFTNVDRVSEHDFTPSDEDILRARLRTSGIVERDFEIHGAVFKFLDVGGQRNERRKWMHCFEAVTAVIFVAAISEYDQVLYEDEKQNRLHEALKVFESICNSKYFETTAMILFLNKTDLFHTKFVEQKVDLRVCFPDYMPLGGDPEEDAKAYIKEQFLSMRAENSAKDIHVKDIFCHFTCATDTDQVEKVFEDCRNVILKKNLDKLGLS